MDAIAKPKLLIAAALAAAVLIAAAVLLLRPDNIDDWSSKERSILSSLRLNQLPPVPLDPSNAHENNPAAISLGKRLFSDQRFSSNKAVSCASCHHPDRQFQDGLPLAHGVGTTERRAMPLTGDAYTNWLYWDGRADSLWAQALSSLEGPTAHAGNRLADAHLMAANYLQEYEAAFGPMPNLGQLPKDASPLGTAAEKAAWGKLTAANQAQVSRIFANMGKAIAAYQKTLHFGEAPLDSYIEGVLKNDPAKLKALTQSEKRGLHIFVGKGQCVSCHNGPLLTDQSFHNIGVPVSKEAKDGKPDPGRAMGLVKVQQSEFNCLGSFSDAKPEACVELRFMNKDKAAQAGNFKTPGLRNVALRPPYMHTGQFARLVDVVRHYEKAPLAVLGHNERDPLPMTEQEIDDLVAFFGTLSGAVMEIGPVPPTVATVASGK